MAYREMTIPPPPPGFVLENSSEDAAAAKPKSAERLDIPPPPPGFVLEDPVATDGDTVRSGDARVRVVGVDAPEIGQRGFDRQGNAVPVGEASRDFLQSTLDEGEATVGPSFGQSWGRRVAPVNVGVTDAGLASLRYGQGFAAPDYLLEDPERRADYLQAESLARTNRLGVHGVYTQEPSEFRTNPVSSPDTRTIAQFFDTPTPLQPLPPLVRDGYAELLRNGSAAEINAFLAENGYETARPDDLRAWVARRDAGEAVDYAITQEAPPPMMIDSGDGATGAFARKFGSGFLAGGLDEVGAVVDTLGGTDGRENVWNSDRRLADIWANNQRQNAGILAFDQTNSPTASTVGEVSGALTSGFAIPYGAGARTVPQLAKVGGVYGGVEGFLGTDGRVVDRAKGAVIGVPVGAGVNAIGGKALEYGAPVVARGVRRLLGRDAEGSTRAAGEAADAYGEEQALDGALAAAGEVPPPPAGFRRVDPVAMADNTPPALRVAPAAEARRMSDPTTRASLMASASNVTPGDVVPMPSNFVDGVEEAAASQAGRFTPARAPNERDALTRQTITNFMGDEVPKVGPVDMVGFLRTIGGLKDQGGELAQMGITSNAARRGLEHVGQEMRFGPLLNENGLTLDNAALAVWEAGYFPEMRERPDVNTFLDVLRDTYDGGAGRRFRPDDAPEIEDYDSLQAERYDFEQNAQEAGGLLWQDRSSVAEEGAPFPPVQAYEGWPAGTVKRAGNINLDKLQSPQDIKRALVQTERHVGFDAATRGRVAQAETERLAADLNMTPGQLLARRQGQAFNAEEALAARQILAKSGNELVNFARRLRGLEEPGDEMLAEFRHKLVKHAAIQEQVSGMTAEAGRALQQFRQAADSKALRGSVLGALVRAGGGKETLQEAAETLLDAAETSPGIFNAVVAASRKPRLRDKIAEFYINVLLSGPQTHAVNMASNTLTAIAQLPEYATGALIGKARQAISGNAVDRVTGGEVGARAFGLIQGAREGASLFARALKTGEPSDFASKVEGEEFKAISGLKGEMIRVPTRLLTAEDEFFKGVARRMEINAMAVRKARSEGLKGEARQQRIAELVAYPTDEMHQRALEYGKNLTFQQKLGPIAQRVSDITQRSLVAKVFLPFVRTPTNLVKFAAERSPAAPLLKEWRDQFKKGGADRDVAIAKLMLGTGLGMAIYQAALEGKVTGSAPPDPKKARLLYADGWKPQSIRIGNTWYSYQRFDPFSSTLGIAADLATLPEGMSKRQRDDKTTLLVASILGNLASKTWLSGISDLTAALAEPERNADNLIERLASSFATPAVMGQVARTMDPVMRQRESVGEAIMSRVPGLSDNLLPKRDIFGEPITSDGSVGPDLMSPLWQSHAKDDPVVAEMLRIEASLSLPGKQFTEDGQKVDYTPEEYDRYSEVAGRLAYNGLARLIASPEWEVLNDQERRKAMKIVTRKTRETARDVIHDTGYQVPRKWQAGDPIGDVRGFLPRNARNRMDVKRRLASSPPPGFFLEESSFGDPVGDLRSAIPGIGITSGYRDEEYQADMRRRGYRPARNSAHLVGDSLDLTPPSGKSLNWLAVRVKKARPDARLLKEGDHLHITIPGWGAAPALGGAADVGVTNPIEIPPPPDGFVVER